MIRPSIPAALAAAVMRPGVRPPARAEVPERGVVYVTEVAGRLWVIHAFRKKSKTGIGTPKTEIDLIGNRLARLRRETMS